MQQCQHRRSAAAAVQQISERLFFKLRKQIRRDYVCRYFDVCSFQQLFIVLCYFFIGNSTNRLDPSAQKYVAFFFSSLFEFLGNPASFPVCPSYRVLCILSLIPAGCFALWHKAFNCNKFTKIGIIAGILVSDGKLVVNHQITGMHVRVIPSWHFLW